MPKGNSSKRGLINVALNGLVSTGVIAGFRINYATREEPDQVQITVTSPSGARQESIRAKVLQALGEIGKGAKFVVEPSGGQPTGPMTPQLGRSRSRRGRSIVSPVALPPGRARTRHVSNADRVAMVTEHDRHVAAKKTAVSVEEG